MVFLHFLVAEKNREVDSISDLYEGALIKESIDNEMLLDYIRIRKVKLWIASGVPKYWTIIFFTSDNQNFPNWLQRS